jgi:hypothetical protein
MGAVMATQAERDIVHRGLEQGLTPDEIADQIAHHRALVDVNNMLSDLQYANVKQQTYPESHYSFLPPPVPPTAQELSAGSRKPIIPVVVTKSQFSEFCKTYGLDPSAMLEVWEGERFEHHLWRQYRSGPQNYGSVQHHTRVHEMNVRLREQAEKDERAYQKRMKAAVTNQPPAVNPPAEWGTEQPASTSHVQVIRIG